MGAANMRAMPTRESTTKSGRLADLYRRHAPDAGRLAYLLTGDRSLSEDLVQEAFVRLLGRFADLRNPELFHWYLRRTVVNLVNSHFRHLKVERAYLQQEARRPQLPSDVDVANREDMWKRLLGLPERQRTAIVLRFYEDLTEVQTADVMGCPVGTVKSLVWRGLERLRIELAPER
jgi:RNA polymerase sigma-70 factor (sigma-E family)